MRKFLNLLLILVPFAGVSALELSINPGSNVVGEVQVITAKYEDTFVRLARRYNLGFEELKQANPGVDPWLPGEGTEIVLPTQFVLPGATRRGVVINLPEMRLYYYPANSPGRVITHPVSVGRMEWQTPLGRSEIIAKTEKPAWYPPESIRREHAEDGRPPLPRVVPPGPENPLGDHAMRLSIPGYLIHGTNKPSGLGMRVTHGCIRMFPEDIEGLFGTVPIGTPVHIVDQPYKLAWSDRGVYLEAHPPLEEEGADGGEWATATTQLTRAFIAATEEGQGAGFDWELAELAAERSRGIPEFISLVSVAADRTPN